MCANAPFAMCAGVCANDRAILRRSVYHMPMVDIWRKLLEQYEGRNECPQKCGYVLGSGCGGNGSAGYGL